MITATIQLPDEIYEQIQYLAAAKKISPHDSMLDAILSKTEDTLDYIEASKTLNQHNQRISPTEVIWELNR